MPLHPAWRAVAAMFALNGALFGIWASRIPAVKDSYDLSPGALGILLLFLAGGAVCSFPLAGKAADRRGAANVTRALAIAYPLGLIALPLSPNVLLLAAALFAFGALHGAMDVTMNAWAAEVERHVARPVMSSFHAMFSLGAGLGALSGFVAAQTGAGLPGHFTVTAIAATALTYPLARLPWASVTSAARPGKVFAFPSGALVMVGVVAMSSSVGEGGMADWSAVFLRLVTGTTEGQAALGYAVFSAAMVVMRLAGDRLTLRLGPVATARLGGLLAALGAGLAVLNPGLAGVLAGFALMGLGYAVIVPLAFSRAANDPDIPPGQAIASVATLGYGGLLMGPPVIGFLAEFAGLRLSFAFLMLLALVVTVLARALRSPV